MSKPALQPISSASFSVTAERPRSEGKFLYVGDEKSWIRGVTYGTFRPDGRGSEYHDVERVAQDFALIAANGMNAIRTYTAPPRWLLDAAQGCGLRVMVGLPWEQHVAFLEDKKRQRSIENAVRAG
ncbi:MAG: glycosyl transferase, partial [Acidobacteria bacterium]